MAAVAQQQYTPRAGSGGRPGTDPPANPDEHVLQCVQYAQMFLEENKALQGELEELRERLRKRETEQDVGGEGDGVGRCVLVVDPDSNREDREELLNELREMHGQNRRYRLSVQELEKVWVEQQERIRQLEEQVSAVRLSSARRPVGAGVDSPSFRRYRSASIDLQTPTGEPVSPMSDVGTPRFPSWGSFGSASPRCTRCVAVMRQLREQRTMIRQLEERARVKSVSEGSTLPADEGSPLVVIPLLSLPPPRAPASQRASPSPPPAPSTPASCLSLPNSEEQTQEEEQQEEEEKAPLVAPPPDSANPPNSVQYNTPRRRSVVLMRPANLTLVPRSAPPSGRCERNTPGIPVPPPERLDLTLRNVDLARQLRRLTEQLKEERDLHQKQVAALQRELERVSEVRSQPPDCCVSPAEASSSISSSPSAVSASPANPSDWSGSSWKLLIGLLALLLFWLARKRRRFLL
eukprot:Hpha_TRINITY_DN14801_c1_g7::TRINITY_DN14801_c1_g7_i1::g.169192::m.169192